MRTVFIRIDRLRQKIILKFNTPHFKTCSATSEIGIEIMAEGDNTQKFIGQLVPGTCTARGRECGACAQAGLWPVIPLSTRQDGDFLHVLV